ncbi:hypothetical protein [Streptomyces noursei]|uniref:hypothetical protein n=1 Tax=Streptomyces noursei TaxID=1971 RepID=UPI0019CD3793|nr:hypothetical protein [Streptomyces noursei]MCZ1012821.1 hypothetical protein [Streptomyces noursei]GGX20261.1 hypothetical protein GCM10010341_46940 [Streptomyces noursei]
MLTPRLLRHALDFTSIDRILLSGDHPFHRLDAATLADFLGTLPDRADQHKLAHANAQALYRLDPSSSGSEEKTTPVLEQA